MKKVICIILIVVAVIILCYLLGKENPNKKNEVVNNVTNSVGQSNKIENKINSNTQNEIITNEIDENNITNEIANTIESETFEESPKSDEQKAIKIVKEDWGEDSSVSFSAQGINNKGEMVITVTDKNTRVLAFYYVDVKSGDFRKGY